MSDNSESKVTAAASRRILVIEDNSDSAEVLQTFLEINGHEITVKPNASEGLRAAQTSVPDIIICDISLSGDLDGYDVAEEIRRHEEFQSTFLIALSGFGRPEDKEKSKSAGFNEHLTKPTDFNAFGRDERVGGFRLRDDLRAAEVAARRGFGRRKINDRAARIAARLHRVLRHRLQLLHSAPQEFVIIALVDRAGGSDFLRIRAVRTRELVQTSVENHVRAAVRAQKAIDIFLIYFRGIFHIADS